MMTINNFAFRHTGHLPSDIKLMLEKTGAGTLEELIDNTIPSGIRLKEELKVKEGISEVEYMCKIRQILSKNKLFKNYIGMGYYGTVMPAVIQRNILESPGWYTSYTPYQAEISQGRLEALLNFQTMITELTGMEIANASLLDEATAAAEAMMMFYNTRTKDEKGEKANKFYIDELVFPQTLEVVKTRAAALRIEVITADLTLPIDLTGVFGAMVQYPDNKGRVSDYEELTTRLHSESIPLAVAADIMSLVLLVPPGKWGADVVFGSTQRFGVPVNFGGPHAAFFAASGTYKRNMPGRIIGVTIDRDNRPALRMALQTREQHIKREKATSNICTAQALLATMAGMYTVFHGYEGLYAIASRIHKMAAGLSALLEQAGYQQCNDQFFDTLQILLPDGVSTEKIRTLSEERQINLRYFTDQSIGISLDETTSLTDLNVLTDIFYTAAGRNRIQLTVQHINTSILNNNWLRKDKILSQKVFSRYRSETELMRYIKKLERKDFSLAHGMIPLGSCTMKLNAAIEMLPLSWPELGNMHPFVPHDQAQGYFQLFSELEDFLKAVTGLQAVSFQPNSGAAGEYTGLLVIKKYLESRGQGNRNVVLIPASAHGTNPASAAMAGLRVVVVNCDDKGNIDVKDLETKAALHQSELAAFMVTYPSTHGVFETAIVEMTQLIHQYGGQVYMDGANMNAQVGLTNPAVIGADVCHLNLHKTFAIPHGGGGPGAGPIVVAAHLAEFLPSHPVSGNGNKGGCFTVSSAPWGSAGILVISHAYCNLLGREGLTYASKIAILNANYLAAGLKDYFPVLYTGENGFVGHEMILDCRSFKTVAGITETDIAKRLMDYGFHAPTLSFPVHGTLMVEPTESESLYELNRFIEAMIGIHKEITEITKHGNLSDNLLRNAPHTQQMIVAENWVHPYTRKQAAFPVESLGDNKYWPTVGRVDDAHGDRNLVCTCSEFY